MALIELLRILSQKVEQYTVGALPEQADEVSFGVVTEYVVDPTELYRIRDGAYAADLLIAAVAKFDMFTWLADHAPVSAADLRLAMGWALRPADVLVTLCSALGLVWRDLDADDRLEVTDLARQHLTAGSPLDLRAYYASLSERPAAREFATVLRTDGQAAWASATAGQTRGIKTPPGDWSARLGDVDFARRITAAMDARGAFLGPALAVALTDLPIQRLLDVGGSSGIYTAALLEHRPDASGAVFERPPVDAAARTLLAERGLAARIDVVIGDMFTDPLPSGFDVHLYSQVLHDWDLERVTHLLRSSFDALTPGGWLIDHDSHINSGKTGPRPVAEYSALLMHSTPGKCWSVRELSDTATDIGFIGIEHWPTAGDRGVFLARKPNLES